MRRFEFSEGGSNKFWEIAQNGADLVIRWGRIGTQGQSQAKSFADVAKAKSALDKLVAEKTGKGYVETTAGAAPAVDTSVKVEKNIKQTPAATIAEAAAAASDAGPAAAPSPVAPPPADVDLALDMLPPLPSLAGSTP
ncbi:WGR domain-containing protein, partial [Tahibacter caeni]|uniref:WGR domain-containing protein n=1 Tax=Tahibacter caeni TaxID=1453545 RepID=UPI0021474528